MNEIRVVDVNKTEEDILLCAELDELADKHADQFKIAQVLSHPESEDWGGLKGHVNKAIIKQNCFAPGEDGAAAFFCGPSAMIQKAALPALKGRFACDFRASRCLNCHDRLGIPRRWELLPVLRLDGWISLPTTPRSRRRCMQYLRALRMLLDLQIRYSYCRGWQEPTMIIWYSLRKTYLPHLGITKPYL